jgi:hypothetical protein
MPAAVTARCATPGARHPAPDARRSTQKKAAIQAAPENCSVCVEQPKPPDECQIAAGTAIWFIVAKVSGPAKVASSQASSQRSNALASLLLSAWPDLKPWDDRKH